MTDCSLLDIDIQIKPVDGTLSFEYVGKIRSVSFRQVQFYLTILRIGEKYGWDNERMCIGRC